MCLIGGPWRPLSIILEEAELSSDSIQEHHCALNPCALSVSKRNGQERVSKAFEISSLSSSIGTCFFLIRAAAL